MAMGTAPVTSSQVSVAKSAAVTTDTVNTGVTPTVGNTMFWEWGASGTGQSVTSLVETNVAWSSTGAIGDANATTELLMGVVSASPGTVVTVNTAVAMNTFNIRGSLFEWAGLATTVPTALSRQAAAVAGVMLSPSITPTPGAECLLVAFGRLNVTGLGAFVSTAGGFTDITPSGSASGRCSYRYIASASGSYQAIWNYTSGTQPYDSGIAVFYAPAVGGFKSAFARNANSYLSGAP